MLKIEKNILNSFYWSKAYQLTFHCFFRNMDYLSNYIVGECFSYVHDDFLSFAHGAKYQFGEVIINDVEKLLGDKAKLSSLHGLPKHDKGPLYDVIGKVVDGGYPGADRERFMHGHGCWLEIGRSDSFDFPKRLATGTFAHMASSAVVNQPAFKVLKDSLPDAYEMFLGILDFVALGLERDECERDSRRAWTEILIKEARAEFENGDECEGKACPGQTITYKAIFHDESNSSPKDREGVKWAIRVSGKQKNLEDENGKQVTGEKINLEMKDVWVGKEIILMPYLDNPVETVAAKTMVSQFRSLNLEINNSKYGALSKDQRDLLILEIINIMEEHNIKEKESRLDAGWVKYIRGILKREPQNTSFLKVVVVLQNKMPGKSAAVAAFGKGMPESNSEFLIYLNATAIAGEISVGNLRAYFIHELRHFWQHRDNEKWEEKLTQKVIEKGEEKIYKDIRIEVDAHTIQFEFERKLKIGIDEEKKPIRGYFEDVEKVHSGNPSEEEKLKADYLSTARYNKANGYINPLSPHLNN
jgi:hypothetical protein